MLHGRAPRAGPGAGRGDEASTGRETVRARRAGEQDHPSASGEQAIAGAAWAVQQAGSLGVGALERVRLIQDRKVEAVERGDEFLRPRVAHQEVVGSDDEFRSGRGAATKLQLEPLRRRDVTRR